MNQKPNQKQKYTWQRIKNPIPWQPFEGEIIEGEYLGESIRESRTTPGTSYRVHYISTEKEIYYVTGAVMDSKMDIAKLLGFDIGDQIRVEYTGTTANGVKHFNVDFAYALQS